MRLSARTVANFCANRLAGELSAVVELCRLFPEIANNENTPGNVCIISQPHADVHCGLDVMGDHLAR